MDVIGKLRHPNVVRFRAYYYAREEKFLIYDYLPNGSLHSPSRPSPSPAAVATSTVSLTDRCLLTSNRHSRPYSRRQSVRFKATEVVLAENLFQTSNTAVVSVSQFPDDKEEVKDKSDRCLGRRNSVRCKATEVKTVEDMFEANNANVSTCQLPNDKEHIETKRFSRLWSSLLT